jgi:hypothetical protein
MILMILSDRALAQLGLHRRLYRPGRSRDADQLKPVMIVITMQVVLLVLGTFMESLAMILLCVPIYFPIIEALHWVADLVRAVMLLNMKWLRSRRHSASACS